MLLSEVQPGQKFKFVGGTVSYTKLDSGHVYQYINANYRVIESAINDEVYLIDDNGNPLTVLAKDAVNGKRYSGINHPNFTFYNKLLDPCVKFHHMMYDGINIVGIGVEKDGIFIITAPDWILTPLN